MFKSPMIQPDRCTECLKTQPTITCSKLTIETLKQGMKYRSGVFIVNFEDISHLVLVFLMLTLSR